MKIPGFSFWSLLTTIIVYLLLNAIGMAQITAIIFSVIWYVIGVGAAYAVARFHSPPGGITIAVPDGPDGLLPPGIFAIAFSNQARTIYAPSGGNLRSAAIAQQVDIHYGINKYVNCFGLGQCGTCRYTADTKAPGAITAPTWQERFTLGDDAGKVRLACQSSVIGNCNVNNTIAEEFARTRYFSLVNGAILGIFSLLMLGIILWMGGDMIGLF